MLYQNCMCIVYDLERARKISIYKTSYSMIPHCYSNIRISRLTHSICITRCTELSREQFVCLRTWLMDVRDNNLAPEEGSTLTSSVYYDTTINWYTIVMLLRHFELIKVFEIKTISSLLINKAVFT